ncbi:polyprenyl synthetase family protein [Candidatus Entotheonella palauensis]|uniref:polyprenyl synthetase family protein n=1 Tax=Candidatus Entotheonella palauensis TaxID=93172 RepID=UPI000B7ED67F|nr:farnesyl diphosphate synthase [Candidatus Entotheonella palauensis]
METLEAYLHQQQQRVEKALDQWLPALDTYPPGLMDAMRYSVFAGGKRLRPIMMLAAAESVGGDSEPVLPAACALECIHTYSMIHDDLPAMDNDDYRRGKPTNHVVYGEAMAILAGDALLTHAFEILSSLELAEQFSAELLLQVNRCLSNAAGSTGMIGGQVVDTISEGQKVDLPVVEYIHRHKTAALIEASTTAGGLLGGGSLEEVEALRTFGHQVGWAFQITDDILDVEGNAEILGKAVGRDAELDKATYPAVIGVEASRQRAQELMEQGLEALRPFGDRAEPLRQIAVYIVSRDV